MVGKVRREEAEMYAHTDAYRQTDRGGQVVGKVSNERAERYTHTDRQIEVDRW